MTKNNTEKKTFSNIHECSTPAEREQYIADLWRSAMISTDEFIAMIECERKGEIHKSLRIG
jgi:hypothetical protein